MNQEIILEPKTTERLKFIIEQYNNTISASSITNEAIKRLYQSELAFINRKRFDSGQEQFKEI